MSKDGGMRQPGGMEWLAWLIAGPTIWAIGFSAAYGVHGLGCAYGWPALALGPVSLYRGAIVLVGLAALLACALLLTQVDRRLGARSALPRLGIFIGLFATLFTLSPALVASSC